MKRGDLKHEMTLFHTMGRIEMFIPDTPYFYDHIWSQVELFSDF